MSGVGHTGGRVRAVIFRHAGKPDTVCIKDEAGNEIVNWMGFDGNVHTKGVTRANARRFAAGWNVLLDAPLVPGPACSVVGFQSEVADWMLECFGVEIAEDRLERADRFIEEAMELAQTIPGFTADRAHALVDYVFSRPVGERGQEVGGTMVTLAALCNTYGVSIGDEAARELARVWTKVDEIRAKQAAKPNGSVLPVDLRCDFCGMERSTAASRGLTSCAAPFDVREHQWTGAHRSHRAGKNG